MRYILAMEINILKPLGGWNVYTNGSQEEKKIGLQNHIKMT